MREVNIGSEDKVMLWVQDNIHTVLEPPKEGDPPIQPIQKTFFEELIKESYRRDISLVMASSMTTGNAYLNS